MLMHADFPLNLPHSLSGPDSIARVQRNGSFGETLVYIVTFP